MSKEKDTLTLSDFMVNSKLETPIKLPLTLAGKETGHYLMVKSAKAKSLARDLVMARIGYEEAKLKVDNMPDDTHEKLREFERQEAYSEQNILLAKKMIVGWSYGDFDEEKAEALLRDSDGLADSVVAIGFNEESYLQKK